MDWQKYRLVIASFVLVALGAGLWFAQKKRTEHLSGATTEAESPLPEIDRDALTDLEITQPGHPTVHLAKRGDAWRVVAPVDAETDHNTVTAALEKLSSLEFVTIAATNPQNHERLEVDDAHAIHVVAKAGNRTAIDLRVGAYRGGNTLVRVNGGNDVIAVRGSIKYAFNRELKEWRNREIVTGQASEVQTATWEDDQGTFRFVRNDAGEWVQELGHHEHPIHDFRGARVDSLVAALVHLRASDFGAPDVGDAAGFAAPRGKVTLVVRHQPEGDAGTPTTEEITLLLGAQRPGHTDAYLQRVGNPIVYVVPEYVVDKIHVNAESFQQPATPDGGTPPAPEGEPSGEQPPGGMNSLPPEVLQQLQRQLQQQGLGGH